MIYFVSTPIPIHKVLEGDFLIALMSIIKRIVKLLFLDFDHWSFSLLSSCLIFNTNFVVVNYHAWTFVLFVKTFPQISKLERLVMDDLKVVPAHEI